MPDLSFSPFDIDADVANVSNEDFRTSGCAKNLFRNA